MGKHRMPKNFLGKGGKILENFFLPNVNITWDLWVHFWVFLSLGGYC